METSPQQKRIFNDRYTDLLHTATFLVGYTLNTPEQGVTTAWKQGF